MAENFKNGVKWYAVYVVDPEMFSVKFPEGVVRCGSCPMAYSDSLGRARCRFTGEIIETPIYYPELPDFCPLDSTGEIVGTSPKKKGD